ncbi:MAG TPA: heme NO-binding domain-containing protein [Thermoanaerobaculia bacterium]
MHGFIFSELKKYVAKHFGEDAWEGLLRQAGLGIRSYENFRDYPDDEVVALVTTASQMTKLPAADILEGFGEFIAADLVAVYRPLIDPSWRTLEFLENVESVIHRVVRARNQKARPPAISCSRVDADEVMITYGSKRKLCALARGIVQGTAHLFGEEVAMREDSCMLRGDRLCLISVRRLKPVPDREKTAPVAVPVGGTP